MACVDRLALSNYNRVLHRIMKFSSECHSRSASSNRKLLLHFTFGRIGGERVSSASCYSRHTMTRKCVASHPVRRATKKRGTSRFPQKGGDGGATTEDGS